MAGTVVGGSLLAMLLTCGTILLPGTSWVRRDECSPRATPVRRLDDHGEFKRGRVRNRARRSACPVAPPVRGQAITAGATEPTESRTLPPSEPVDVTDADFDQKILRSPLPVMVDFCAEWCPPCRQLAPTVDELANEYRGRVLVAKLDVDANEESLAKYQVEGIPTLLFFKEGRLVERLLGLTSKEKISRVLDSMLAP